MKKFFLLFLLILNISSFATPMPIKDSRILYLIQETQKEVIQKIKTSNIENKEYVLNQLEDIKFLEKNLGKNHPIGMEIYSTTRTLSKNNNPYKVENIWTDKFMLFNPDFFNLTDHEISYNIKYQFTVFLVYFYLNEPPKTKGDIKDDKTFRYLAKIIDFPLEYSPQMKKYKGEFPVEDARILFLVNDIQKEIQEKIKKSNLINKEKILNDLKNIDAYKTIDSNNNNLMDIKMVQTSYGNENNTTTKWDNKRILFQEKAYYLPTYILKPSIKLQFAKFIYNFSENNRTFNEEKFLNICDIVGVNPKDLYSLPKYPNETLVEDSRILYFLNLVHQDSIDKISKSNLKNKEKIIEQFEYINAYRTKNHGNKIAEMILNEKAYESSSQDQKKILKTTFYDDKRILFREKAFNLNDFALINTIKHEFAHALVAFNYPYEPKDDHGKEFKDMCKILGVDPKYSQAIVPMTEKDMLK